MSAEMGLLVGPEALPQSFDREDLTVLGFTGWQTWDELRRSGFHGVPAAPAAYVVYRESSALPQFVSTNPGGWFKGNDPTVATDALENKWVPGAHVIYIGKADVANRRLKQFARFGAGEPVGHWGGRYIWQLADSGSSLIAWHAISWLEEARAYEKRLLTHFTALHNGSRPFANLTG